MPPWLIFTGTAIVVIVAGAYLARTGDAIAERTGLGATWVGAILVAGATSLPEVATDAAAVWQGQPDLAVGDLFGSSMANMTILAVADLVTRQSRLLHHVALNHAMVAALAISLTSIAAVGVLSGDSFAILGIGWAPLLIGVGYVLGMRLLHENREQPSTSRPGDGGRRGLRRPIAGFTVAAVVILVAAPYLASSAATLSQQLGIASGFFGVVFLAAATSLPEAAVVFTAVRQGAHDLAVGNLIGSNCFNMMVLPILDVLDGSGPLLGGVETGVVIGALVATLLMGQVVLDVLNRPERRVWFLEPGPALTLATYAGGLLVTYRVTH
jgi:cation:H+ antiporter